MIKKIKKCIKILLLIIFLTPITYAILASNTRLGMLNLPTGDYIDSLDSPNKEHTLKSYRYSGGATVDWSLRVEVVNNKTGKKQIFIMFITNKMQI